MVNHIKHNLGLVLVTITCIISLFIFKDHGISWDEDTQRETGKLTYEYIFNNNKDLLNWPDKDYGVAFELPLYIVEKALNLKDSRDIYLSRHITTHLFFLIGAFFLFLLIDFLYKNKWLATLGFLLLVLNPRIYAHSFFNTKDIPFLAMFIICLYATAIAFNTKKTKHFILLGLCYGILLNLRLMGVLLPFISTFLLFLDYRKDKNKTNFKLWLWLTASSCLALYVSWPYLWNNPFGNFFDAFRNMSKFRWGGHNMFFGEYIEAYQIGWIYVPTWFSITTPLFNLISGVLGLVLILFHFIKQPSNFLSNPINRNHLIYLASFLTPIFIVILLRSVLYDGWRQLYFIYPSFILLCIYLFHHLFKMGYKKIVVIANILFLGLILKFMVLNHPFQHIYFNLLVDTTTPEYLRQQFELDYWGTSYKQAYEYILKNDTSKTISVKVENIPGNLNTLILPSEDRNRIKIVNSLNKADYFITNYRGHYHNYTEIEDKKWHTIKVENNSVNAIFKLK